MEAPRVKNAARRRALEPYRVRCFAFFLVWLWNYWATAIHGARLARNMCFSRCGQPTSPTARVHNTWTTFSFDLQASFSLPTHYTCRRLTISVSLACLSQETVRQSFSNALRRAMERKSLTGAFTLPVVPRSAPAPPAFIGYPLFCCRIHGVLRHRPNKRADKRPRVCTQNTGADRICLLRDAMCTGTSAD